MTAAESDRDLRELANFHGLELEYEDAMGQRRHASTDAVLAVLQSLGAPLARPEEAAAALQESRQVWWRSGLDPVSATWEAQGTTISLRMPVGRSSQTVACCLHREDGEELQWRCNLADLPVASRWDGSGADYVGKKVSVPQALPAGYHRLEIAWSDRTLQTLLICAPQRAYAPTGDKRTWGVFAPLYALHSRSSCGGGDFADLDRLLDWIHNLGGGVVATLPLLATFLDETFEPSPYSPVSRLFWNEFYLDINRVPELAGSPAARRQLSSVDCASEMSELRALPLVDYRRQMALKRALLSELLHDLLAKPSGRRDAFEQFSRECPRLNDYARFRAVGERLRMPWTTWPKPLQDGIVCDGDYDEDARLYHLYVQWLAEEQVKRLSDKARKAGPGLYLDLPLGVHPHGYDVWRERDVFSTRMSGGCPPDTVFPKGQNWGFPPLHPQGVRARGYRYIRDYLQHILRHAGILRIDHIPGFHRLFWIPDGMEAADGVYVRYAAEELYAIYSVESHRHRSLLVGEDLGTVPPEVPEAMSRHGVHRMYVVQYAAQPTPATALPAIPEMCIASLNTHDMPSLAAFWAGWDIQTLRDVGLIEDRHIDPAREQRRSVLAALVKFLRAAGLLNGKIDPFAVLRGCLIHLAKSRARVLLVNLEDLWLEAEPQNVPGAGEAYPNWRRKTHFTLEDLPEMPQILGLLREIDSARGEISAQCENE